SLLRIVLDSRECRQLHFGKNAVICRKWLQLNRNRHKSLGWRQQMTEPVLSRGALKLGLAGLAATLFFSVQSMMSAQQTDPASASQSPATSVQRQFLDRYCATC